MSFLTAVYIGAGYDIQRPIRLNPEIREWIMVDYQRGSEFIYKLYKEAEKENFCWKIRIDNENYQKITSEEVDGRIEQLHFQNPIMFENEEFGTKIYYYHSIIFPNRDIGFQYKYIPEFSLPDYPAEYIRERTQNSRTLVCSGYSPHEKILEWMYPDTIVLILYDQIGMNLEMDEDIDIEEIAPDVIYHLMENEEKIHKIVYIPCEEADDFYMENRLKIYECHTIGELNEYVQLKRMEERTEMDYESE
jgi:hypothetical protein